MGDFLRFLLLIGLNGHSTGYRTSKILEIAAICVVAQFAWNVDLVLGYCTASAKFMLGISHILERIWFILKACTDRSGTCQFEGGADVVCMPKMAVYIVYIYVFVHVLKYIYHGNISCYGIYKPW